MSKFFAEILKLKKQHQQSKEAKIEKKQVEDSLIFALLMKLKLLDNFVGPKRKRCVTQSEAHRTATSYSFKTFCARQII